MSTSSSIVGEAVLSVAVLATFMLAGCGDNPQTTTSTNNPDNQSTVISRTPTRDPVQDSKHTTTTDNSGTRSVAQDRALVDNADKQAAGVKADYNGIAKPIGNNASVDRLSPTDTRPDMKVDMPDAVAHDVNAPAVVAPAPSVSTPVVAADKPRAVDNSGQNENDKQGTTMTPMDQGTSEADIAVTRTIRKALTGDSTLSTNAQNLKVITRDGIVVLRGPVASQAEADAVLSHARTAAGASRIENQIAVPVP